MTGIAINEVNRVNSPLAPEIKDTCVGCLIYRQYDASVVAESGGIVIHNDNGLKTVTQHNYDGLNFNRSECEIIKRNVFVIDAAMQFDQLDIRDISSLIGLCKNKCLKIYKTSANSMNGCQIQIEF